MLISCKHGQNEIINLRRELHKIPELGNDLPKTMAFVQKKLDEYDIDYTICPNKGGIIAEIVGNEAGKTIAFRADMDALAVHEENDVDYKSVHDGLMHACGHDGHTAMLLYSAKVLKENQNSLNGKVRFLFQTSEETASGAKDLIKSGALDNLDAIFGMHLGSFLGDHIPSGTIISAPGCCMASADKFYITVNGKGCHGSAPEKGIDPINIASHIVINMQSVIAREFPATHPVVLTFGKISGGSLFNVIPEKVELAGTIRTTSKEDQSKVVKRINEIVKYTAETFGGTAEVNIVYGTPPLINNKDMANFAANIAKEIVGEDMVIREINNPSMGGEDFAYFVEKIPGAFLFLSTSDYDLETHIPHHSPRFQLDESVLWQGSALFVLIAENFLR